ncbi:hypothetical protein COO60DRAFT_1581254 [Scenedesmus sp. NREL 46B-D3]|nr:hypothetical protein COO60DRAFT_1581254 [Scenedesmus sp. NREL 46B-D3]
MSTTECTLLADRMPIPARLTFLEDSARQLVEHNKIYAASCEANAMALYFQRNLLISGGRYAAAALQQHCRRLCMHTWLHAADDCHCFMLHLARTTVMSLICRCACAVTCSVLHVWPQPCSVFLFFVMRRLLDIQGQLFETRTLAKEAAMQQQQLLDSQPSGAPASEQHRKLQHMLSKLDRAVSNISGDGEAADAAVKAAKLD